MKVTITRLDLDFFFFFRSGFIRLGNELDIGEKEKESSKMTLKE